MKNLRKSLYNIYKLLHKYYARILWKQWTKKENKIKINIGASETKFEGWFQTEQYFLDVSKRNDFVKMFSDRKINYILAEHVLEHITNTDLAIMLKNFVEFAHDDVNIRIAVPDGFHKDPVYIENVKPGGIGAGAHDHKNLFTYRSLSKLFSDAGFEAHPIEYWDENGIFHQGYINDDKGHIRRSFINDNRNASGKPVYTSLIIDFTKK
ncbi:MAG: methyltransferase domain-containing protein [Bacteroidota bacterium]